MHKKRSRGHLIGNCSNFPTSYEGIFLNDNGVTFREAAEKGCLSIKDLLKNAVDFKNAS